MTVYYLDTVRARRPLVHNITSGVAAHFYANSLLALGASPLMTNSPLEAAELAAASAALVLNIGMQTEV